VSDTAPTIDRKAKMKIPHQPIEKRPVDERVLDFGEIYLPYSEQAARLEASRCLQCPDPKCVRACPLGNDIPAALAKIAEGQFLEAAHIYRQTSPFPEICGRVCPQEKLCEGACPVGKRGEPVACGRLEVFATDYERKLEGLHVPPTGQATGYKVAVVGAGPAGLACADRLVQAGHEVTVFDAMPIGGGLLTYGIPRFKLNKLTVMDKITALKIAGVKFAMETFVGRDVTIDQLMFQGFEAVFVGTGAEIDADAKIEGSDLKGVYQATDYLIRGNLSSSIWPVRAKGPLKVGQRVAVIGGGDTATDCLRTSIRLGAKDVVCLYRRTEAEMPGNARERKITAEEGARYEYLVAPVKFIGDDDGQVKSIVCQRMELGEPDKSGRRRPIPIAGSEFEYEVDTVVLALGYWPDPLIGESTPGLQTHDYGLISADSSTGSTSRLGVFAGGDNVTGPDLVSTAAAAGIRAARAIDEYLQTLATAERWYENATI
jgi:glutamate synthase (NADPH/NADH) small chain